MMPFLHPDVKGIVAIICFELKFQSPQQDFDNNLLQSTGNIEEVQHPNGCSSSTGAVGRNNRRVLSTEKVARVASYKTSNGSISLVDISKLLSRNVEDKSSNHNGCSSSTEAVKRSHNGRALSTKKVAPAQPDSDTISLVDISTLLCRNVEDKSSDQVNECNGDIDIKFQPMAQLTMDLMKRKSLYYMGLEHVGHFNRLLHIINSTSLMTDSMVEMKIMLSLRKQRLNEEFEVLGDLFDIEKTAAEQYYEETKSLLSNLYNSRISPKYSAESIDVMRHQSSDSDDQSSSESSEQADNDSDVVTDDFSDHESTDDSIGSRSNPFLRGDTVECTLCRARVSPGRLDSHMQNVHLNPLNLNKTICGLCIPKFERFRTSALLREHQNEVHDGASCMCDVCGKMFNKLSFLRIHLSEVHAKHRPFLCDLCGASYFSSSKLRVHTQTVHTKVRNYACKQCDKKYFQSGTLRSHVLAVHHKDLVFKCRFGCDKSFSRPNVRQTHEQMHKVNYSCEICSKVFSFKCNLLTHCKNIHGSNVIDAEKCRIEIKK